MNVVSLADQKMAFVDTLQRDLEKGGGDLPVLPRSAETALRLAQSPHVDFDEVVRVAEADPPLAARFLGVANSALYFRGVPIRSVKGAVVRLGTQATRDVLYMAVYSGDTFKVTLYQSVLEEIFRHSIVVARMSRRLAELTALDSETAFLSGLLHDVGRARCLKLAARRRKERPSPEALEHAVNVLHPKAGADLAAAWHLPEDVIEACEFHHDPEDRPMALCVYAADFLAHFVDGHRAILSSDVVQAVSRVGLDEDDARHLVEVAREDAFLVGNKQPF